MTSVGAVDRLRVAWMLALQIALALGVKLLTAPHEQRIAEAKRLVSVGAAVLFEARHTPTPPNTDSARPPDL